jgi:hypothetical protein
MCTFNTASGCDCLCECDVLLREDRDLCPVHGTKAQEAKAREVQAVRKVSVGRTQPLWESPSESTAIDEIWETVERMYFDGRITWQQRGLFLWAARTSREDESPAPCSRRAQSLEGVEEL